MNSSTLHHWLFSQEYFCCSPQESLQSCFTGVQRWLGK